jgi:enhancing lycopene biosynthesis protein 2
MKTTKSSSRAAHPDSFCSIEVSDTVAATIVGGIAIAVGAESSAAGNSGFVYIDPTTKAEYLSFDGALGNDKEVAAAIEQMVAADRISCPIGDKVFGLTKYHYFKYPALMMAKGFGLAIKYP